MADYPFLPRWHPPLSWLKTTILALREQFDQQAFHDFVLAQGLLPPELLSQAVMTEFVPSMMN